MSDTTRRRTLIDVVEFSRRFQPDHALRSYQMAPARAIVEHVLAGSGEQLAVVFSRQAGKDELLAQVLAYLLWLKQFSGGNVVLAAPTYRPQAAISRDRLLSRLGSPKLEARPIVRDGYAVNVGRAAARFVSANPAAHARGQTADLLLVANEAQEIDPVVWDTVFDPMAASTNATTLFLGTVWSRETLLARQLRHLDEMDRRDGRQRVWRVAWDRVADELPAYGERVRAKIEQLGPDHPSIRTEYCLQELDGDESFFTPARLAMLRGDHDRLQSARAGARYALLIDVAGEEEAGSSLAAFTGDGRRDSTALTVVEIDGTTATPIPSPETTLTPNPSPATRERGGLGAGGRSDFWELPERPEPLALCARVNYRVVDRMVWTGVKHAELHGQMTHLAREVWRAEVVVIDATGIGMGLSSFLGATLAERRRGRSIRVVPFVFTQSSKSVLGWDLVGLIDSGRLREYRDDSHLGTAEAKVTARFWAELRATTFQVLPGPGKVVRWSVPAGRGHDDLVMSLALVARLDSIDWRPRRAIGTAEVDGETRG